MVEEEDNSHLFKEITSEEMLMVMYYFHKERIPGLYGRPIEFFIDFYDVLGLISSIWWKKLGCRGEYRGS
jgi:hypothetical protein